MGLKDSIWNLSEIEQSLPRTNNPVKPVEIASAVCLASFGIACNPPFIPGKHHPDDKVWDKLEGCYKAANQMRWYLKKVCFLFLALARMV